MSPKSIYQQLLVKTAANMGKYQTEGFRSVQVFGANARTCPVCRSMVGKILPTSTPAAEILRSDCERLNEGNYHCALMVSPAIKDGRGDARFDRFG